MRIVYDHRIFCRQERGGISRYFVELARELAGRPGVRVRIVAPLHLCASLRNLGPELVRGTHLPRIRRTTRLRLWLNDRLAARIYAGSGADIHHWTYYGAHPEASRGAVRILTVFDMIHERFPELMPAWEQRVRREKREAVRRADHLICISEQTRQDLLEILDVAPERTTVIHLGSSFARTRGECGPPLVSEPYLLYVGNRQGPKNFSLLLMALASAPRLRRELTLVCFGGGLPDRDEQARIRAAGLDPGRIRWLDGDDARLHNLYSHALALVYPSLYEGFGLPLVEAMACDCPVLCARSGSLPEVAGEAAAWFDPRDPESLRTRIEEVVDSETRRRELVRAGRRRVPLFTWQRCAEKTLEVYERCLQR